MKPVQGLIEVDRMLRTGRPISKLLELFKNEQVFELTGEYSRDVFYASAKAHFNHVAKTYLHQVAGTPYMVDALDWQLTNLPAQASDFLARQRSAKTAICDIGAGVGAISSWPLYKTIRELRPSQNIALTGIDIEPEMAKQTKNITVESIPTAIAEMFGKAGVVELCQEVAKMRYHLGAFPTVWRTDHKELKPNIGPFHFVVCSFVLHHLNLEDKRAALNKIYDLLDREGMAIVVDEFRTAEENIQYLKSLLKYDADFPHGLESFVPFTDYFEFFSQCRLRVRDHAQRSQGRCLIFCLEKS